MKTKLFVAAAAFATVSIFFAATTYLAARSSQAKPQMASAAAKPYVVPDLAERVAKFKLVRMPFHAKGLSAREIKMVDKLVDAAGLADCIYWRQSDPGGLKLFLSLAHSNAPQDLLLRRYLTINGSRFDLIDDEKPFADTEPMPPGRGFYPAGLTVNEINAYVATHPDQKAAIFNSLTVIRKNGDALEAIPYRVEYRQLLEPMAKDLNDAADLSDDAAFANYLRLRAGALLTDDYYPSDLAWLDLKNPKFDLILAPYETYTDGLLGVKATFGASVMIRNDAESEKLAVYQKYVPDLQESLPLSAADLPSKRDKQSPMEVVDSPYRAGDLLHGYQAVADNLPNDPRVHVEKGSKKIFWKNFMDARVNFIILPLARRLMRPDQAALASADGYLADTLMHEISHGLGPSYARTARGQVDVNEAIGASYSALEESKADVVGELCYKWLIDHGAIPKEEQNPPTPRMWLEFFGRSVSESPKRTVMGRLCSSTTTSNRARSPRRIDGPVRDRLWKDARRDCISCEGVAGAGSHRRQSAHRCLVQEVWRHAARASRPTRKDQRHPGRHRSAVRLPPSTFLNRRRRSRGCSGASGSRQTVRSERRDRNGSCGVRLLGREANEPPPRHAQRPRATSSLDSKPN